MLASTMPSGSSLDEVKSEECFALTSKLKENSPLSLADKGVFLYLCIQFDENRNL